MGSSLAIAEETQNLGEVVVTARKTEEPLKTTAHSIDVVTGEDIKRRVDRSVAEALQELPGVVVQPLGTRGESVTVRLRGATNADTLVLLDGVRLNNPVTNETNLGLIPVEQIDRIEVLRGSQAVLYGGSAVGGVVNIITRKGTGPAQTLLSFEGGNFGHTREWLGLSGEKGKVHYDLGVSRTDDSGQFKNDRFGETALTQRWDVEPAKNLNLEMTSHILLSQKHFARDFLVGPAPLYDPTLPMDAAFLQLAPDVNRKFDRLITTEALKLSYDWSERYRTEMLYGFFLSNEEEKNPAFGDAGVTTPSGILLAPNSVINKTKGIRQSVDLRQFFFLPDMGPVNQEVTVGFEFYDELVAMSGTTFPNDAPPPTGSLGPFLPPADTVPAPCIPGRRQNYAPYLQYHLAFKDRFFMDSGFRYDRNSAYGGEISPRFAVAVMIPEVQGKFHAAYGEGFLPPTTLQLFNPISGNPNLMPQTSKSVDAGYEQRIGEKVLLYATFFYIHFDNQIGRLGTNTASAFTDGLETGFTWRVFKRLNLGANYTFTHSRDETNGLALPEIPAHVFNATLSANPWKSLTVDSTLSVVSSSRETFPLVSTDGRFVGGTPAASLNGGNNAGYALWDIALAYDFLLHQSHPQAIKVFTKVANLLNQNYEVIFGFPNPGLQVIGGAEIKF